jgi:hypothetical protein
MTLKPFLFALVLISFGAFLWHVRSTALTDVDSAPEVPCDEWQWKPMKEFDRDAWLVMRSRERYVEVLKKELIGKSREDIEALLGQPTHHLMKPRSSSYGYLLGRAPYVACAGALSQWLAVQFGEDSKVREVKIFREH